MNAKLFIKSLKDPIDLEYEEGEAAQALIGDTTKPDDTPFVIEGVWSGKKRDMRFVVFEKKERTRYTTKDTVPMNDADAKEYQKKIEPFKAIALENGFKEYDVFAFYLQGIDIVDLKFFEMPETEYKSMQIIIKDIDAYKSLVSEYESFSEWNARKEYGARKRLEGLQELADQMTV